MTDEEVERLRRVAYGPGARAAERAAAEAALRELDEQSRIFRDSDVGNPGARESDAGVLTLASSDADADAGNGDEPNQDEVGEGSGKDDAADPIWGRRIRVGWLVPIVVGSLVVGVLGTLQMAEQFAPEVQFNGPYTTTPSAPPEDDPVQIPGDLEAADTWFDGPATASDAYPIDGLLESNGIDPHDVRFALARGDGWNVWVGRSGTGGFCLLIADAADGSGASSCVERVQFAHAGIYLGGGTGSAYWYGDEVTTSAPDS